MTEGTREQADALLRRWEEAFGKCVVGFDTRAYLATRPAPVDPDLLIAREAAAFSCQTDEYADRVKAGEYDNSAAVRAALRAIKLAKEQQA